ncbi:chemotaxis protein CheW [Iodobacter fluviatilis]|uniref:Chemotaxis protein CheW n=1 Tax=Iodobacter fluviatilis TaxID=537 RepID=A0A377Q8R9_9NEIS|nr:chemotaxis protein CheW [Iodobacter fluviatilis]TCU89599.1 purine-binding chemotaxis protein CheW [Iodobacter fluviatilis]STQ90969.1 Chemotaxis protein CheW [Iodobacter fluviatilis]
MNIRNLRKNKEESLTPAPAEEKQYLTFTLNQEIFAVIIHNIKEIIEYAGVTEVPLMPQFMHGVINMRGAVVPVIDLAVRFGKGSSKIGRRSCVVILEVFFAEEYHDIGVLVDSVNEVIEIPASRIEPPPEFGAKVRSEFIAGIGSINDKFVIILDVNHALSLGEMADLVDENVNLSLEHHANSDSREIQ